jgi:predicted negative regulator of RcsB-dependent stress response
MPALPPKSKPAGDNRNLVLVDEHYAAPGLEDHLRLFWEKYARLILTVILAVAIIIVGRGFYRVMLERRAEAVQAAYAAATTESQLQDFIAANPIDPLAGVAQLRLADGAYLAGNFSVAAAGYTKTLPLLAGTLLAPRAQLGIAVSQLQSGEKATATAALTQIADAGNLPKAIRAEAAYDLAVLAAAAGQTNEVIRLTVQIATIDPTSQFAERVSELTSHLSAPAPDAAGTTAPAAPPATKSDGPPAVVFPLPASH